jgi:outer membrane protein TolC
LYCRKKASEEAGRQLHAEQKKLVLEEERVRQADQQLATVRNNRVQAQANNDQLRTELTTLEGKVERKLQVMY